MPGNILILRECIQILPYERTTVSYDYLSQLLADYLLTALPDVDISAALSIMPATRRTCLPLLAVSAPMLIDAFQRGWISTRSSPVYHHSDLPVMAGS